MRSLASANPLLDDIAWNLLGQSPETATSLGVDTGAHAALRGKLTDRSEAGQRRLGDVLRRDLARARAADTATLDPATRTSFEVVESAYSTALEGFALPYGDVAVGGWRNAPYVVIQNVGAFLDLPRFMDSEHPLDTAADAEAYLARLDQVAAVLDGETDRIRDARGQGVVPPDFLLDKALAAMGRTATDADKGDLFVADLTRRLAAKGLPEIYAARARTLVTGSIAAALERQQSELKAERALAKSAPGIWAQPDGDQWYAWALRASTTTQLSL